jgi:hypothetical protein
MSILTNNGAGKSITLIENTQKMSKRFDGAYKLNLKCFFVKKATYNKTATDTNLMKCSKCKKEKDETQKYKMCLRCRTQAQGHGSKAREKRKENEPPKVIVVKSPEVFITSLDLATKACSKCKIIKTVDRFYKSSKNINLYRAECISCHKKWWNGYYEETWSEILADKFQNNPIYRLGSNIRSYIQAHMKYQRKEKEESSSKYIGCTVQFFRQWLIYNNPNYEDEEYHMDHVIPVSLFDLHYTDQIELAFHWTNIQVLKAKDNLSKSNKLNDIEYFNHIVKVHYYISKTTRDFSILKKNLQFYKNNFYNKKQNIK